MSEYPLPTDRRSTGRVRGLHVEYGIGLETIGLDCVVKEPRGTSRAGLAGAGRREVGLYQSLAAQLPMPTPVLIAADLSGNWLILEAVEADIPPSAWTPEHFRLGVKTLASLHERFWNLGEDLGAYPWLARPLGNDFEIHVYAAAQAVEKMIVEDRPRLITGSMMMLGALGQIISQVEQVVEPLRAVPQTLLHGNFWPGNVALQADGEMVLLDWELAGLGPGILDLVSYLTLAQWEGNGLLVPEAELIALYQSEMRQRVAAPWSDAQWSALWDNALIWRFVQEMFTWAASASPAEFEARATLFEAVWIRPVLAAVDRRLRPVLYI